MNKSEITRLSEEFTQQQMKAFLFRKYGILAKDFPRIMASALPRESEYQRKILSHLRLKYKSSFVYKAAAGPYSRAGVPDVLAVIDGMFFGFEVKRPYIGKLSSIQRKTIHDINAAGGFAGAVSFPRDCDKLIAEAMKIKRSVKK